jgi:hypothetical protein
MSQPIAFSRSLFSYSRFSYPSMMSCRKIAIALVLSAAGLFAQAQQGGSLADAARQARADRQAQPQSDTQAQQLADQLAEDQTDNGAPGGFKTYNAGDYKIWVPAPYKVEGNDDVGVVLSGPSIGSKHSIVLLGSPIVVNFAGNDSAFQEAATQFAHQYAQSASCTQATVASHNAYQCGLAAATMLGQRVTGHAVFVQSQGNIYPVFCVAPSDSRSRDSMNTAPNAVVKSWAQKSLQKEDDDLNSVLQKCDTVFQSIRITEGVSAQKAASSASKPETNATTVASDAKQLPAAGGSEATNAGGSASLAEIARGLKQPGAAQMTQAPEPAASTPAQSSVPAGFKVQSFTYCKSQRECYDASVIVPADAQLVSSQCKQFIFETKVQGTPFLLLAGPGGSDGCAGSGKNETSEVRWNELAEPEKKLAPGTYSTISSQQATLNGKPAIITQIGFRKGLTEWRAKRAEIESNGVPLVMGCMALKEHFDDGDSICSGLMGSLQLP